MRSLAFCVAIFLLAVLSPTGTAQDVTNPARTAAPAGQVVSRFEAGVLYTNRGLDGFRNPDGSFSSPPGRALGPAIAINLSRNVALDALVAQTPQSQDGSTNYGDGSVAGGHSLQFLAGPRVEVRGGRLGLFLAARAGFLNWSRVLREESAQYADGTAGPPVSSLTFRYGGGYYPAVEAAAGVEYAVKPHTHLRLDIGDQFVQYHTSSFESPYQSFAGSSRWTTAAFFRTGVMVGFGPAASRPLAPFERTAPHRFFDRTNAGLIVLSAMGQTADYVTTEIALHRGGIENNGLARPFLNQGWPGTVPVAVIVNSVQIGLMYGLHKIGHHRLERLPPLFVAAGAGHGGYVSSKGD